MKPGPTVITEKDVTLRLQNTCLTGHSVTRITKDTAGTVIEWDLDFIGIKQEAP